MANLEKIILREKSANRELREQNRELEGIRLVNEELIARSAVLERELAAKRNRALTSKSRSTNYTGRIKIQNPTAFENEKIGRAHV